MPIMQTVIQNGGGGGSVAQYLEYTLDSNNKLKKVTAPNISGAADIDNKALYYVFYNDSASNQLVGPALLNSSNLVKISGTSACNNAFYYQQSVTSTCLDNLKEITGVYACYQMFQYCTGLTATGLNKLEKISGSQGVQGMFQNCTNLTDAGMERLRSITSTSYYMFSYCSNLETVRFSSLWQANANLCFNRWFGNCSKLKHIYFPSLTASGLGTWISQFDNMLFSVTGCTVHFPANLQSTIGSWSSITGGMGGTNTVVLFDLPSALTLTGVDVNIYVRNPRFDTVSALAWGIDTNYDTPYYTSGLSNPTVGATIYSDAACTTPVTTIDSIV